MGVSSQDAVDYLSSVRRIIRFFAKVLLVLAGPVVLVAVQNMDSASAASIWFADHRIAHRLDPATTQITAAIPLPSEAEALAIDVNDASLWALAHKRLLKFDAATSLILDIDLKSLSNSLEDPKQLLLSPYDSSLWVVSEKTLLHLNRQGQGLYEWRAPEKIRAVALGLDESLWLATQKELLHLSVSGSRLHQRDLKTVLKEPEFLAIDSLGGWLWLADHDQLIRLNANDPTQSATVVYQTKTRNDDEDHGDDDRKISSLVLDSLTGRVWLTTKDALLGFDRTGILLTTVPLASDLKETEALAYDFASQSLWLGAKKAVTRLASDTGAITASIPVANELEALAVSPLRLEPALSLIQPGLDTLTNNPKPPLRLGLMGQCSGAPCNAGNGYLDSLMLNVTLNGVAIGSQFAIANNEATYLPAIRLPEGLNAFTAKATDVFGHVSNTVTGRFTIDTIPPKFLSLTPADGSVVNTQPITIGGSLDDPAATVILENMALLGGSVIDANPEHFSFSVPLKPGTNTFNLIARDPAGNTTTTVLQLTYNPVSVQITSPVSGITIDADHLLVNGTFQGPSNLGITVNGVVAAIHGDKFYASNVPLNLGENAITAIATTPEGLTASQTIKVISTATSAVQVIVLPQGGIAPLKVAFRVANNTGKALQRIEADYDGNGSVDFTSVDFNAPVEFTYSNPGVYQPRIAVTDGQNVVHRQDLTIVVRSISEADVQLRGIYTGMLERLKTGDVENALSAVSGGVREKYRAIFTALKPKLPEIADQLGTVQSGNIGEEMAEYVVVRNRNGKSTAYFIYLIRGEDGVWRIDGM